MRLFVLSGITSKREGFTVADFQFPGVAPNMAVKLSAGQSRALQTAQRARQLGRSLRPALDVLARLCRMTKICR